MNITTKETLASIVDISRKRQKMLYNRSKFMLETKEKHLKYRQHLIADIGIDPSFDPVVEKKLQEQSRIKKKVLMKKNVLEACKDTGGVGDYMYDAINPSKYIQRSRRNLEKIDESFDNCFSNFFKSASQIKLQENRMRLMKAKSHKLPQVATRDSLMISLKNLKNMKIFEKTKTKKIKRQFYSRIGKSKLGLTILSSPRSFKKKGSYFWSNRKDKVKNFDSLKKKFMRKSERTKNNDFKIKTGKMEPFKSCRENKTEYRYRSEMKKKRKSVEEVEEISVSHFGKSVENDFIKKRGSFFVGKRKVSGIRPRKNTFTIGDKIKERF